MSTNVKNSKIKKTDYDYDRLESLQSRLDTKLEFSNLNSMHDHDSLLYEFESCSKILSFNEIKHLASGFIRIYCKNLDPKNADILTSIPLNKILKYSQFGYINYSLLNNYNPLLINKRKYCYNCFKSNISNKNKLFLYCSRCKTAKYCNQNCQKQNWKYHKNSCISIKKQNKIKNEINKLTAEQCVKQLQSQHKTVAKFTFQTICYFKRITYLLETHQCPEENDIGYNLHVMPPKYSRFYPIPMDYYKYFFSSVGIPEFIFNSTLTRISRIKFYKKFGFPINWNKFDGKSFDDLDWNYDSDEEQEFDDDDTFSLCEFKGLDAYQMAFYIVNMLIGSMNCMMIASNSNSNIDNLIALGIRRLFEWYSNPDIINDCGDALGPLSLNIDSLMPILKENEFAYSPNLGKQFKWDNFIMKTSFLDCLWKEYLEGAQNKRYPLNILNYIINNISHNDIWNDKRNGSYFVVLFSFMLTNISGYDYDDTGMNCEKQICRKALNIAFDLDNNINDNDVINFEEKKSKITKFVEYIIRYQCKIFEKNEAELNAKMDMFKFRPYFGFKFSPYDDRPFWYYFYFYFLKKNIQIIFDDSYDSSDDEDDDDDDDDYDSNDDDDNKANRKRCIVENAYYDWKSIERHSDIYKLCFKASLNKAEYVDWMRMMNR